MTNIRLPIEQYDDLEIKNLYRERVEQGYDPQDVMESIWKRGRDNARTPMQWNGDKNAGFTQGTPWLPVNPNYETINAQAALKDPDSVFYYYQKLISLRKTYPVFRDGDFRLLCPEDPQVFAYTRESGCRHMLVACNFTKESAAFSVPETYRDGTVLISNYPQGDMEQLRPYEAKILYWET